jgi:putative ABC transport system permease protein
MVQAVVMFLVLAATATTTVVIALGLVRRLFTHDHRLIDLPALAGPRSRPAGWRRPAAGPRRTGVG